jgi:asparagine synthase (glutamine-hydrolysing)
MPGISVLKGNIIRDENNEEVNDESTLSSALNSVMHNDRYIKEILLKEESFLVACTKYPEYPTTIYEDDHFWVCIEGKIYGQDDSKIKREINTLLFKIFFSQEYREKRDNTVDNWLSTTDGEFIIYALNKRNKEFVVINDILGRLPLYYYSDDARLIISRELPFITYLIWHNDDDGRDTKNKYLFNKMAIAQYLLFGYTLERRTLLNDIFRLQPGALARLNIDNSSNYDDGSTKGMYLNIENLFSFNFEQKKHVVDSLKENTDNLVSLFSEACKNRADLNGNNIISLSGGFDSRIVAACFHRNKIPCRSVTYLEPGWKPLLGNKSESEIAKRISNNFGLDWKDYGPIRAKAIDFLTLLRVKVGSVHLGYSFMLPLLEVLKKESTSDINFITGYGGGRVLVNLLPPKKSMNMDELAYGIIHREGFLSLSDVSKLLRISEEEIINELKRVLMLHPEKELDQKYVHFIIYGGSFKAIFEVEDRDRLYFWSTSPFYSIPLFKYVMNCSDDNKSSRALHRELLRVLSPSAAAIDNSDYGCSIVSYKFKVIIPFLKSIIFRYPVLKRIAALIVRNKDRDALDNKMIMCLKDQMKNCEHLSKYFSNEKLKDMASNPARYGLHAVYHLFTIVSLIEKTYSNKSTIEKYYD